MKFNIAIDGPSAAGKSTIAKKLAKRIRVCTFRYRSDVSLCCLLSKLKDVSFDDEEK